MYVPLPVCCSQTALALHQLFTRGNRVGRYYVSVNPTPNVPLALVEMSTEKGTKTTLYRPTRPD